MPSVARHLGAGFGAILAICVCCASIALGVTRPTEIEKALRAGAGMQADFVQRFTPQGFKAAQVESGSVVFGPAPKMRWEYSKPEPKTFVFDGTTSWLYTPADRQVTVARIGDKEKREIPFLLLSDSSALHRHFTVRERRKSGSTIVSEIRPRDRAALVREVIATIDRATGQIRSLTFTDRQGNRTVFELRNYRKAPHPALAFRFTPPPGVDVIQSQER